MSSLELDRGKHAQPRVTALAIVEDLEELEDRIGELDPGPPPGQAASASSLALDLSTEVKSKSSS